MSNLFASLTSASNALRVYRDGLDVVQNNIANSTTPGYAKQTLDVKAQPFDVASGLAGGVAARGLDNSRDEYADEEVRRQIQSQGRYDAQVAGTSEIDSQIDVSGNTGISADLNALLQSFSAWSVTPSSTSARQTVIANAGNLANDIHQFAGSLAKTAAGTENQIRSTVDQVNQLTATIQGYNIQRLREVTPDPGTDASIHAALEQLSQLVDVSVLNQPDGTVSVLLNGGSPLVVGSSQYPISAGLAIPPGAANPAAPPSSQILDWQGHDATSQIEGGKLGGLLDFHNRVLASLRGDGQQAGSLNQFAKAFADTVNGILQSGTVSSDPGAAQGLPMFVYDASYATKAAGTFALNPNLTTADLAPVDAGGVSNGNAIQLASLASSTTAGGLAGATFGDFFSGIVSSVGRETATAQNNQQTQQQVVAQTRALRDQISGVSLDEQAVMLLQYQRNYQAMGRFLTTLNDIADTTINLLK